jgi:hypothetical protein
MQLNAMTITMFESQDTALKKLLLVMVPEKIDNTTAIT